jgi:senataxin
VTEAVNALAAMSPFEPRAEMLVYRLGSANVAIAQLEACGRVALSPLLWPIVSAPEAHCRRGDVQESAARLATSTAPLGDRRSPAYNDSQLQAINMAVGCKGAAGNQRISSSDLKALPFTLIQGPPGTGKTHTIVGIIIRWLQLHPEALPNANGWRCSRRVLVCAPSNIAVDEVALRLQKFGVKLDSGERWNPCLVRLGVRDSVDASIVDSGIFVDDCIQRYWDAGGTTAAGRRSRNQARTEIIEAADVVLSTIGSIRSLPPNAFSLVIADEAAMTTEPMNFNALSYGCDRCVLVGDPAQLQATVLSPAAQIRGYGRSLMQRLLNGGYPCQLLNVQYRMHPDIAEFPNRCFYGGELRNAPHLGDATAGRHQQRLPLQLPVPCLRLAFFDVAGPEQVRGTSLENEAECAVVIGLLKGLREEAGRECLVHCGVISFYQAQVSMLRDRLRSLGRHESAVGADSFVSTVDGFQGRERAGIIISCVRSLREGQNGHIGFLTDTHRLNVALTRAQQVCVLVGDSVTLARDPTWQALLDHCRDKGCFIPREAVAAAMERNRKEHQMSHLEIPPLYLPRN